MNLKSNFYLKKKKLFTNWDWEDYINLTPNLATTTLYYWLTKF